MEKVTLFFVKNLKGIDEIGFVFTPSQGRSGGIILMWDELKLMKNEVLEGRHSISVLSKEVDST